MCSGASNQAGNGSQHSNDDHYLDGVALNLHGFYSGLERIFELVATRVDNTKPSQ